MKNAKKKKKKDEETKKPKDISALPFPTPTEVSTSTPPSSSSVDDLDPEIATFETAILSLLRSRKPGTNCCPSEVPRRLVSERGTKGERDWRRSMPAVREAAARLVDKKMLEITQKGVAVSDPRKLKGPIRLRLVVRSIYIEREVASSAGRLVK